MNILTDDEIVANWLEFDSYNEHALPFARAIEAAILAKLGEPVAWRYKIIPPGWTYSDNKPNKGFAGSAWDRWQVTPLYRLPEIEE